MHLEQFNSINSQHSAFFQATTVACTQVLMDLGDQQANLFFSDSQHSAFFQATTVACTQVLMDLGDQQANLFFSD